MSKEAIVCELSEPTGEFNHMQYYKGDVLRWRIAPPSPDAWGYFWDERSQKVTFFPDPTVAPVSLPTPPISLERPALQNLSFLSGARQVAPVFAGITHDSGQEHHNPDLYSRACRYIDLLESFTGALHTVDVGTHSDDPHADTHFSKLAVDTGSSTTWIFGKDVDVINETGEKLGKLRRRGAHSNYVRGAEQIPHVRGQQQYEDGSHLVFDLHRGPFYLKAEASVSNDGVPYFKVCRAENFMFGVATSSSKHFEERHIDGILGLGVVKGHPVSGVEPDLFVNRLRAESRIEKERFTLALGQSNYGLNQHSLLIIGESDHSGLSIGQWSSWMPTVSGSRNWSLTLESLTLAGDIVQVDQGVVFDSGTSYSYLPLHVFQWLTEKLNGTVDDMGRYIYPRAQPDSGKLLRFKFKHGSYDFPLLWLLDFGLPPNATIHGQPAAWGLFKAGSPSGVHSTDESHRQMSCILGNSFLRGMLVEFERKGTSRDVGVFGNIRMAARLLNS